MSEHYGSNAAVVGRRSPVGRIVLTTGSRKAQRDTFERNLAKSITHNEKIAQLATAGITAIALMCAQNNTSNRLKVEVKLFCIKPRLNK